MDTKKKTLLWISTLLLVPFLFAVTTAQGFGDGDVDPPWISCEAWGGDPDEDGFCTNGNMSPYSTYNPCTDGSTKICDDNCPNTANSNQFDDDNDGIGDACDNDTIYGTVSGDVQAGVSIDINFYSCGLGELVATTTTNAEGYYAAGGLENGKYGIYLQHSNYILSPTAVVLQIPQAVIQPYNFIATARFVDNGDGTVTDSRTGLIWLKNANCYGKTDIDDVWDFVKGLADGECGLNDGSAAGTWRIPTLGERQKISTDPPTVWPWQPDPEEWWLTYPPVTWSKPDVSFENVQNYFYYTCSDGFNNVNNPEWYCDLIRMEDGAFTPYIECYGCPSPSGHTWPVRDNN